MSDKRCLYAQGESLPPSALRAPSPAARGKGKRETANVEILPLRSGEASAGLPMLAAHAARRASHMDVASTRWRQPEGGNL